MHAPEPSPAVAQFPEPDASSDQQGIVVPQVSAAGQDSSLIGPPVPCVH